MKENAEDVGFDLPPDPECMNDLRSDWAAAAISLMQSLTGVDEEDALSDLLCDLMHWCDRNDYKFADALTLAQAHYAAETQAD